MRRKRHYEEKTISILKKHEAGALAADLARRPGVAENTIYRRTSKYGSMDVSNSRRLRELAAENR